MADQVMVLHEGAQLITSIRGSFSAHYYPAGTPVASLRFYAGLNLSLLWVRRVDGWVRARHLGPIIVRLTEERRNP